MPKNQQFKLNYFDIIKGVLFPNRGLSPAQKAALAAKPSSTPAASTPATPTASPAAAPAPRPVAASAPPAAAPKPVTPGAAPASKPAQVTKTPQVRQYRPALWTVASVLSLVINVVLIIIILVLLTQLTALRKMVGTDLLGGLYNNFVLMDQAHIKTTITVQDTIPIKFDLPISQDTVVVLNQDTSIDNVLVQINTGSLVINSYARIVLPAQTNLPIHLAITVPVETQVPVTLNVPVDIALNKTDLHRPFVGLQGVVSPYYGLFENINPSK